jgi:ribosomal protein S18 acetylase RimI-like enzyme
MSALKFRRCNDGDRDQLHALRSHAEAWLAKRGFEQQGDEHWSSRAHLAIDRLLDTGRFVALCDDDWPLVVAALSRPDMDFWTADDDLSSAWYLARMMSADHGHGYGALLVETLAVAAAANGRTSLRLDCMRENTGLHGYYRRLGFQPVRVVEHPERESGALFERPVNGLIPSPWDSPLRVS